MNFPSLCLFRLGAEVEAELCSLNTDDCFSVMPSRRILLMASDQETHDGWGNVPVHVFIPQPRQQPPKGCNAYEYKIEYRDSRNDPSIWEHVIDEQSVIVPLRMGVRYDFRGTVECGKTTELTRGTILLGPYCKCCLPVDIFFDPFLLPN